jgi:hypothetical protein
MAVFISLANLTFTWRTKKIFEARAMLLGPNWTATLDNDFKYFQPLLQI